MTELWTVDALVDATGGELVGELASGIGCVSIDSREMGERGLFVAIVGERVDGHDYVDDAFENNAVLALVSAEKVAGKTFDGPLLVVADVLEALGAIGRAGRARTSAKIIGVTGSAGKTSTKEALRIAFEQVGRTHASIRSFNNHLGVPLMLANMPETSQFGIFEIGMSAAGEITPLSAMVQPDVAIITNVAPVHLEFFEGVEEIAEAKAEIFSGMAEGGIALIGGDHDYAGFLQSAAKKAGVETVVTYGLARACDVRPLELTQGPESSRGFADVLGQTVDFSLNMPGAHMVQNMLAVLACAKLLDVELNLILPGFAQMNAPAGRGLVSHFGAVGEQISVVDESYNANPMSMRAALNVMQNRAPRSGGKKIFILGDMLELGEDGPDLHRELAQAVVAANPDIVHCVGPLMKNLNEMLPKSMQGLYGKSLERINMQIVSSFGANDLIMLKGSNGMRLGTLIDDISRRFGDPEAC